jgi:hypothetical protein
MALIMEIIMKLIEFEDIGINKLQCNARDEIFK